MLPIPEQQRKYQILTDTALRLEEKVCNVRRVKGYVTQGPRTRHLADITASLAFLVTAYDAEHIYGGSRPELLALARDLMRTLCDSGHISLPAFLAAL
jgi:hypothetical protein